MAALDVNATTGWTSDTGTSPDTLVLNKPSDLVEGEHLLLVAGVDNSAIGDMVWTPPDGFTEITSAVSSAGAGDPGVGVWYKEATGSEPSSYSLGVAETSGTWNLSHAVLIRVTDANASTFLDVAAVLGALATSSAPDSPAITPVTNGALIVAIVVTGDGRHLTAQDDGEPSGFTPAYIRAGSVASTSTTIGVAFKTLATAAADGPYDWTGLLTASNRTRPITIAIRPASGGGGGNTSMSADFGTYTYTGQQATLLSGDRITAEQGTYSLLGSEGQVHIEMDAVQGSFALSGQVVLLKYPRIVEAVQGSYNLVGQNSGLIYSGAGAAAFVEIHRASKRGPGGFRGFTRFGRY